MECRVEFDYIAQEEDELSLKKGDIITNVVQKMDGWWEGALKGKTGMFPDNFVKVVEKPTPSAPPVEPIQKSNPKSNVILRNPSNKSSRRLKALFSYSPEQEDELRLEAGDVIDYIAEVEEGWWRGKLKGKTGIFPSNFVSELDAATNGKPESEPKLNDLSKQPITTGKVPDSIPPAPPTSEPPLMDDDEPPILPPKPVREQARCFYSYQAQNEDELNLSEGDIVTIISKNCDDEGWWRGELRGKTGLFPDNFIKIISASDISTNSKPTNSSVNTHGPKISPQERNLVGVKPINSGGSALERSGSSSSDKKSNGTYDSADGVMNSKPKQKDSNEGHESVSSKVARFSQLNLIPGGMKPPTPTSPTGGISPMSLPTSAIHSKRDSFKEDESGEFNAIERGEKLSHLTVGRAKAPRRRPPSTLINKDGEENGINGNHSYDSMESPPPTHSTPFNLSLNSNISQNNYTPSTSILDGSNVSENEGLDSSSGGSATKPKKLLPWMAELKEKQDKKQGLNNSLASPNTSTTSNNTSSNNVGLSNSSSLPHMPNSTAIAKEPDHTIPPTLPVKAPPLPAKPNSFDKGPAIIPAAAPAVTNRILGKKPAPVHPNISHSNSEGTSSGGSGDSKNYVSYEEHAKLRDRVLVLESELETVRRQVKLLLDRELNQGHIV